jgi:hypothetical protein
MVVWRHIAGLLRITDMRGREGSMDRIRVLVAEDEEAVREALVDLLSSDAAIEVVGAA